VILTEEGFESIPVDGSVLGLPKVGTKMFSKDHRLGNEVLVSTDQDGLVPVSSSPSLTSLLKQESATVSLEASLKSKGSAPASVDLFPSGSSSGVAKLERGGFIFLVQWHRPQSCSKSIIGSLGKVELLKWMSIYFPIPLRH
jgi:hypothetical protein